MRFELLCDPEDAQSECDELAVAYLDLAAVWNTRPDDDHYEQQLECKFFVYIFMLK